MRREPKPTPAGSDTGGPRIADEVHRAPPVRRSREGCTPYRRNRQHRRARARWAHLCRVDQWPVLVQGQGKPAEYGAGMKLAIERGWLTMHESGTYVRFTPAGADLFA
jgi:hypothetical protein